MPAYALFLEPDHPNTATWSRKTLPEHAMEWCIRHGQGKPSLVHTEIVILDESNRRHFATYIGCTADFRDHDEYYTHETAGRWRAIPLPIDTAKLLITCEKASGSKYSLIRYTCALRAFNWLGYILPNRLGSPGHCATLVARLVHHQSPLRRNTNNYAPVTLYHALVHKFICSVHDQEPQCELERSLYQTVINSDMYAHGTERIRLCEKALARHVLYGTTTSTASTASAASAAPVELPMDISDLVPTALDWR